jgi:hypothetical protein
MRHVFLEQVERMGCDGPGAISFLRLLLLRQALEYLVVGGVLDDPARFALCEASSLHPDDFDDPADRVLMHIGRIMRNLGVAKGRSVDFAFRVLSRVPDFHAPSFNELAYRAWKASSGIEFPEGVKMLAWLHRRLSRAVRLYRRAEKVVQETFHEAYRLRKEPICLLYNWRFRIDESMPKPKLNRSSIGAELRRRFLGPQGKGALPQGCVTLPADRN